MEYLAGRLLGSIFRAPPELSPIEREFVARVRGILGRPELVRVLGVVGQHNCTPKIIPGRRGITLGQPFLLSPYLWHVLTTVEQRCQRRAKLPALDQPPAQVQAHLQDVAAKCRALADLIRKGPQPHVALAPKSDVNALLSVLTVTVSHRSFGIRA
jgi:hypothetical protein